MVGTTTPSLVSQIRALLAAIDAQVHTSLPPKDPLSWHRNRRWNGDPDDITETSLRPRHHPHNTQQKHLALFSSFHENEDEWNRVFSIWSVQGKGRTSISTFLFTSTVESRIEDLKSSVIYSNHLRPLHLLEYLSIQVHEISCLHIRMQSAPNASPPPPLLYPGFKTSHPPKLSSSLSSNKFLALNPVPLLGGNIGRPESSPFTPFGTRAGVDPFLVPLDATERLGGGKEGGPADLIEATEDLRESAPSPLT